MKKLEKTSGFDESVVNKKTGEFKPFFNLGPKNNWDKSLETKNVKIIEEEFSLEMKELGYL